MKLTFLIAGLTIILSACNNNSKNDNNSDSAEHTGHHNTTSNDTAGQKNAIILSMDKMMDDMHKAKPTGNNDVDFAVMMVEHHKGAVEMSKVELERGSNSELKAFAQKVIDDQNKEIKFMEEFVSKASKATSTNSADFQKAMNKSMMVMMNDNTPVYNHIDKDFAAQMIPHHQSAVDMAEGYLEYGEEKSLRTLCQNIISSQTKEINWLKEWLAKNKD